MTTQKNARILSLVSLFLLTLGSVANAKTIYVDADAVGGNNGTSWDNAYNYLQDALAAASSGDEIWVAEGIYRPDEDTLHPDGTHSRTATFQLKNGVTLKGGYAGFDQPDPNARDTEAYETILSGDLAGDDVDVNSTWDLLDEPTRDENSNHVVTGTGTNGTAVLDGFTITGGNADGARIADCWGGAIYNGGYRDGTRSDPSIINCTFRENTADERGGGIGNYGVASPTLTNCVFRNNAAAWGGGGLDGRSGTLTNCIFSGNTAGQKGGGIHCPGPASSLLLVNCTLSGNWAGGEGGAIYVWGSAILANCIVWDNRHPEVCGSVSATYSDIKGGWPGEGNIDADPLFVDADGADNVLGTEDDNLRLLPGSPCVDVGDNSAIPPLVVKDMDGDARIANEIVDMGAYEGPDQGFLLSTQTVTVPEGGTATFTLAIAMDPEGLVEVTITYESGDSDIIVESGQTLAFDSSNYWQPQIVTLAAAQDEDNLNGKALISVNAPAFWPAGVTAGEADNEPYPNVLFVDARAAGANNGSSWADAFNSLQDALSVAAELPVVDPVHLWVAQGVYKPDQGVGLTQGDREATFQLVDGVAIHGGYSGLGGPDPDVRDIELYETILSGDLDGNDVDVNDPCDLLGEPTRADNSYHIVTAPYGCETALLDGFIITGGNANGSYGDRNDRGGGMYNYEGNPTLSHCTLSNNSAARWGGGMYNRGNPTLGHCTFSNNSAAGGGGGMVTSRSPTLTNCIFGNNSAGFGGGIGNQGSANLVNCTFTNNRAGRCGGAMYDWLEPSAVLIGCIFVGNRAEYSGGAMQNEENSPQLFNCVFDDNWAGSSGGAMQNTFIDGEGAYPILTNCTFRGNSAGYCGGGIDSHDSAPLLTNCIFSRNSAGQYGGAMYNRSCNVELPIAVTNCTFSGNHAGEHGGAIHQMSSCIYSATVVTNCTFVGNSATDGTALACGPWVEEGSVELTNCILWDGGNEIWNNDNSTITITYSDVEGTWPGQGNIEADPCFVDPGYWDSNGSPGDANDDYWVDGDYHLLPGSPCIDTGDPNYVPAPNETDLDGNPRIVDGNSDGNSVVDMGAYEANYVEVQMKFTPQAFNPNSQGKWFKLHFVLPEGFGAEDVDVKKPALCRLMDTSEVIESNDLTVFVNQEDLVEIEAAFDRGAFSLCRNGQAERSVTILGLLAGAGGQYFYGTDSIKIINKTWEHLAGLASHWLEDGCGKPDWCGGSDLNQDSIVNFLDFALFGGCSIEIVTQ